MPRLKTANCPNCAGDVQIDGSSQQVTCRYCGTTSLIQRGARRAPANVPVIVVGSAAASLAALALGAGGLLLAGGAVLLLALRPSPAPSAPRDAPKLALPALPAPAPQHVPPPTPVMRVLSDTPTLFVDVDGDQQADVVAPISVALAGQRSEHYAVFDGGTAALRARTPPLLERRGALVAVLERRLLLAQHNGQVSAYDLGSGDLQWSSALGERVAALCAGRAAGTAHVTTDAGRALYLDLVTAARLRHRSAARRSWYVPTPPATRATVATIRHRARWRAISAVAYA